LKKLEFLNKQSKQNRTIKIVLYKFEKNYCFFTEQFSESFGTHFFFTEQRFLWTNDFTERGFSERRLVLRQYKKYSIRKKNKILDRNKTVRAL